MAAIPYLIVDDANAAIHYYRQAFGATEHVRLAITDKKIAHAELRVGDASFMLADAFPEMGYASPTTLGGSPVSVLLYVEDVDRTFAAAIAAGGTEVESPSDQFDGDRRGTLTDPFGHRWLIATKMHDYDAGELARRFAAAITPVDG